RRWCRGRRPSAAPFVLVGSLSVSGHAGNPPTGCSETEIAADELLHDLVVARPDLVHAGVLPGTGDAVLVHEAVPAVQLHALVEDVALDLAGPPLGLRGVDRGELALGVGDDAGVDVGLADLDL